MSHISFQKSKNFHASHDSVLVGRVLGAWGLAGDLKIESHSDYSERFSTGSILQLDGQSVRITKSHQHKSHRIIKFDLINSRTHAESFRGMSLTISSDDLNTLPEGAYYHFQMIGIEIWTDDDTNLGYLKEILSTGANDVYIVGSNAKPDILIPALKSVVKKIDIENKKMVVSLPEGLR